jgi:hypothetical protein
MGIEEEVMVRCPDHRRELGLRLDPDGDTLRR